MGAYEAVLGAVFEKAKNIKKTTIVLVFFVFGTFGRLGRGV